MRMIPLLLVAAMERSGGKKQGHGDGDGDGDGYDLWSHALTVTEIRFFHFIGLERCHGWLVHDVCGVTWMTCVG